MKIRVFSHSNEIDERIRNEIILNLNFIVHYFMLLLSKIDDCYYYY